MQYCIDFENNKKFRYKFMNLVNIHAAADTCNIATSSHGDITNIKNRDGSAKKYTKNKGIVVKMTCKMHPIHHIFKHFYEKL